MRSVTTPHRWIDGGGAAALPSPWTRADAERVATSGDRCRPITVDSVVDTFKEKGSGRPKLKVFASDMKTKKDT